MKHFVQEGPDLFGIDPQAEAAAFAAAHQGGLAPMALAPGFDSGGRNDVVNAATLAETGQVNDFQAAVAAPASARAEYARTTTSRRETTDVLADPDFAGLAGIALARAVVARNGHPETDPARRPLATGARLSKLNEGNALL